MNTLWKDPHRRELILAAATGAVWALLGVALAAHGAEFASCRVHNALRNGSANVGSGTLVDVTADRRHGLVLSCAHLFTEGTGRVVVEFSDGRTHGAKVIAIDPAADLSALEIANPAGVAAPVSFAVDAADPLMACGFGPSGQFRCVAGRIVGVARSAGQESVQIAGAVRSGDSGGGVFDPVGRLVGVVWGESGGVTYASGGGPLRRFVERVLGRRLQPTGAAAIANCPNGLCPLIAPGSLGAAPAARDPASGGDVFGGSDSTIAGGNSPANACPCDCAGACGTQLAALAARVDLLAVGKQDRGDYLNRGDLAPLARTDELAQFDQQNRERHNSLLSRLEALGPLVGAATRAAVPLATTAPEL